MIQFDVSEQQEKQATAESISGTRGISQLSPRVLVSVTLFKSPPDLMHNQTK